MRAIFSKGFIEMMALYMAEDAVSSIVLFLIAAKAVRIRVYWTKGIKIRNTVRIRQETALSYRIYTKKIWKPVDLYIIHTEFLLILY